MLNTVEMVALLEALHPGSNATSLCVWCLEKLDPCGDLIARRAYGGDCFGCSYTGRDTMVVILASPSLPSRR